MISDEEIENILKMEDWDFSTAIGQSEFAAISRRLRSAEDALRFYANKGPIYEDGRCSVICPDGGETARAHFERLKTND